MNFLTKVLQAIIGKATEITDFFAATTMKIADLLSAAAMKVISPILWAGTKITGLVATPITNALGTMTARPEKIAEKKTETPESPAVGGATFGLETKAGIKDDHEKLLRIEERLSSILENHLQEGNVQPWKIEEMHTREALKSAESLPSAKELEKKLQAKKKKPAKGDAAQIEATKENLKSIAEEAYKLRLVTDFDRVLNYIRERGKAGYTEISKNLGIPIEKVDECCSILEEEKQLEIIYPPIGRPIAQIIGYSIKAAPKNRQNAPSQVGNPRQADRG
ncbi:MAG: hypothetical protein HY544_00060 [Candidatus Diapherotrites archaeon]|uniref:Uncharacterized protein n=1 Tax=Candidatus Iainarchaeum sp. TaxID=3101447 RepID=A0A8T3YJP7_9ARCH|nr:hypothetical protein [Candidatus Diapherotrites archaeon]